MARWGIRGEGEGKRTEVIRYQKRYELNKLASLGDADVPENQLASLKKVHKGRNIRPETGLNEVLKKRGKGRKLVVDLTQIQTQIQTLNRDDVLLMAFIDWHSTSLL